jgi:hypothetical protein
LSRYLAVYTAIFGNDERGSLRLHEPAVIRDGVDYVCFTDREDIQSTPGWRVRRSPTPAANPRMEARRHKILAHTFFPDHEVTFWLDSRYQLLGDPLELAQRLIGGWDQECVALRHPHRSSLVLEAEAIIDRRKADREPIERQLAHYVGSLGFGKVMPALTSSGWLLRKLTDRTRAFNTTLWAELTKWGHPRDQMAIDFAAHEVGLKIQYACGDYQDNPYARWVP